MPALPMHTEAIRRRHEAEEEEEPGRMQRRPSPGDLARLGSARSSTAVSHERPTTDRDVTERLHNRADLPIEAAREIARKLPRKQQERLWKLQQTYEPMFETLESYPDAVVETPMGVHKIPTGRAILFGIGGVNYVAFQDEPPAVSWKIVRGGLQRPDTVRRVADYLTLLEYVDRVVREHAERPPLHRPQRFPLLNPGAIAGRKRNLLR